MLTIEDVIASQKDLALLCADRPLQTNEVFFGNSFYGMDLIIKKYVNFPQKYPLKVLLVHGPDLSNNHLWQAEIESPLLNIYCYPSYREDVYINAVKNCEPKKSIIPAASPFLYATEILKREPKPNRSGTIFFPSHSTGYVTVQMDFEALAEELIHLDDEYQPVTVCLYWKDFNLGRHIPFQKRGIQIVSAGHVFDPNFLFRFYHLCSMYRYASGNELGTHIFYSIKSGCSYFHLNSIESTYTAQSEALLKHDIAHTPPDRELALKSLFAVPQPQTTPAQMAIVDYYLGAKNLKSSLELRQQLIDAELLFGDKTKSRLFSPSHKAAFDSDLKRDSLFQPNQSNKLNTLKERTLYNTKELPLVSLCIPTFNGDSFILEAISSITSQTYPYIEIIISDDNSSDKTIELIKLILNKVNISFTINKHERYGLANNWNFCISQAKGKYIKFLFQDDLLEPNAIEAMVTLAEQDEEIGLVFSPRTLFTNTGDTVYDSNFLMHHEAKDIYKAWSTLNPVQLGQELLQDLNILDDPINKIGEPSTVLIRKEVFEKVGLFNSEFCQLVDLEMWLRIMSQYKVGFVNQVLSHFRIHPQQQTRRNANLKDAILLDYQKLFQTIYSDTRYPLATRQQALYKYATLSQQNDELRHSRRQIAEEWLNISDEQIKDIYVGLLGKTHKMLLNSSIKYECLTSEEQTFVNDLFKNVAQGLQQPKAIQHLLAAMLYYRADQLPLQHDLSSIPHWLLKDYLQFLFSSPVYFQEPGEADNYYHYMQGWIDYLHTCLFKNSDSPLWHEIVNNFALIANFISIYFNENNLKSIYVKRAEILDFFLKINGYQVDYEFAERPVNRKKIRLGILASHFSPAAETFAYLPIYEYISRDFEVILYSLNQTGHPLEQYCQSCANFFKLLPQDLAGQVNTIRADDLDVLFIATNVTVVTNQICLLSMHRLARIQATSGGSVVTTGMRNIDYYISGTLTDPSVTAEQQYQEKLVRIAGSAHCFSYGTERDNATVKVNRESLGISEETIIFSSGANFFKIIPELVETWAKIIAKVPNSVLILLPFGPNWSNAYPKKYFENKLKQVFSKYEILAERLIVLDPQPVPNREDVKEYFKSADIYLDSYPFSGTTSLVEPLQINLPVVSRQGTSFRSAMGAAMVQALEIADLVADSEESYIQLAIALGNNPILRQQKSAQIKEKMQGNPSFLDSRAYSAKIGNLFQELFSKYLADTLSQNFRLGDINLIIFPDWLQPEELLYEGLAGVISTLTTHPYKNNLTLLIDTHNISEEEADMLLSSLTMNLLMEDDVDITEGPEISLLGKLSQKQWETLLPRIEHRIALAIDNQEAIAQAKAENLPSYDVDSLIASKLEMTPV
ncbi:glycosyltransferase [Calothrix sp. PCC 7507]|uniref:glycosyltransferase n=1 Tax=Calothrix sp. PCC 7507 TaxID=99598 RepID=UPI00029ED8FE|nr:glycosyltransferase [Calothrix sp. PCC 7507]AFY35674.1 glycosyl transferase family 2 [Calothrix sp. PCC 7507]